MEKGVTCLAEFIDLCAFPVSVDEPKKIGGTLGGLDKTFVFRFVDRSFE